MVKEIATWNTNRIKLMLANELWRLGLKWLTGRKPSMLYNTPFLLQGHILFFCNSYTNL